MKTRYVVILCILPLLVSGCAQKVNDPADVQAIKDATAAWDRAWSAGDCEALASLYTTDLISMGPNAPTQVGRDALLASCKRYFDLFREENRSVVEDVRISGDLAVARGTQEVVTSPKAGGASVRDKQKWIVVYARQLEGSWRTLWEIWNSDLPVADSLPEGAEEQALMQIERDWAAASTQNDWAAVDKILAAEYANNTDGLIRSKKQITAEMKSGASKVASAEAGEMKVLVLGDTAIVHGLWTEKSTLNGKDTSGTYRYTDIFAKRDGRWLAVTTYSTKMQ